MRVNIVRSNRSRLACALALAIVPISGISASNADFADQATLTQSAATGPNDSAPKNRTWRPPESTQAARVSAPSSRRITLASPKGNRRLSTSALEDLDVPLTAMIAYRSAERTMRRVAPSCELDWTLLAAIGRVESNHGRYAGSRLHKNGDARPSIRGLRLDGDGPLARVRDSDGGSLDGDKVWDRAVGPMQFLPSTWAVVGVDGDGDGVRSPDNINDASLAAGVYLCEQPGTLGTARGTRRAVYGYNHSDAYVDLVTALARGFRTGDFTVPSTTLSGATPVAHANGDLPGEGTTAARAGTHAKPDGKRPGHQGDVTKPHETKPPVDKPVVTQVKVTKPPKHHPKPIFSKGDDPKPPPEPAVLVSLTGTLTACGEAGELWCVGDVVLDVGDEEQLAASAAADLDGDGTVETNADELTGLAGQEVALQVERDTDPAVVYTLNEIDYRLADGSFAPPTE